MEWKWSDGKPFERTQRIKKPTQISNSNIKTTDFDNYTETDTYKLALNHDENTWEILNQSLSSAGFVSSNKREEMGFKMSDRDMVQQRGFNPFMEENNYVNDITVSDHFLKPVNTSEGRTKFNE